MKSKVFYRDCIYDRSKLVSVSVMYNISRADTMAKYDGGSLVRVEFLCP